MTLIFDPISKSYCELDEKHYQALCDEGADVAAGLLDSPEVIHQICEHQRQARQS